jgi:hypothetical protein
VNQKIKSVISAVVYLVVFVVLPLYVTNLIPLELLNLLSESGFNLGTFTQQIVIMGIMVSVITLVKGFVPPYSPLYLLAGIGSSLVMLAFTLATLGLGNIWSFGITVLKIEIPGGLNTTVLDLRFFIQLAVLTSILQIIQAFLEFKEAFIAKDALDDASDLLQHT